MVWKAPILPFVEIRRALNGALMADQTESGYEKCIVWGETPAT